MQEQILKATQIMVVLLTTLLLCPPCFSNLLTHTAEKPDRLHQKLGCMMCHQSEYTPSSAQAREK